MRIGLVVIFDGARCDVAPIGEPGGEVELAERLGTFCRTVAADPTVAECLSGLHSHRPGECASRGGPPTR